MSRSQSTSASFSGLVPLVITVFWLAASSAVALEPMGSVLRLSKVDSDVLLSWEAFPDTLGYGVERCDATSGACPLVGLAPSFDLSYRDAEASSSLLWYQVGAQLDDRFGPGRTTGDTRTIGKEVETVELGLVIAPSSDGSTDDWWRIEVCEARDVGIEATFLHAEGDINLTLWLVDQDGQTVVDEASSVTDDELLSYSSDAAVELLLQVALVEDSGPLPGNSYDLSVMGAEIFACGNDIAEPNDSLATAGHMPSPSTPLLACPFDQDFYQYDLALGATLSVRALTDATLGGLDLRLHGPSGDFLVEGSGDPVSLTYTDATEAGTYTLSVAQKAPMRCSGQLYNLQVFTHTTDHRIDVGVDDWYDVTSCEDSALEFQVSFDHDEGNIDLSLWIVDPRDETLIEVAESLTDDELIAYVVSTPLRLRLQVRLTEDLGSIPGNTYDLTIEGTTSGACTPDEFEPNDSYEMAVPLVYPRGQLFLCPASDDYYSFELGLGDSLFVQTLLCELSGPDCVNALIYGPSGEVLAEGEGIPNNVELRDVTEAGTYTVLIGLRSPTTCDSRAYMLEEFVQRR